MECLTELPGGSGGGMNFGCLAAVVSALETLNSEGLEGHRVHTGRTRITGNSVSRIPVCLPLLQSINRMERPHPNQHRRIRRTDGHPVLTDAHGTFPRVAETFGWLWYGKTDSVGCAGGGGNHLRISHGHFTS